jgi:hypothetical protein
MKYIKTFETHSYLDELLDKINDSGYDSLTELEKDWLKAHSTDKKEEAEKIERELGKRTFTSSNRLFSFDFIDKKNYGDKQIIEGTIYVPSIEFPDGSKIEGQIEGQIEVYNGIGVPIFKKKAFGATYDVFEFCEGLGYYELDDFIQYIVGEINTKEN